jgi:hypothetical protein
MKAKLTAGIVGCSLSCVVFCLLFVVYGRPIYMVLYTKWKVRNMPEMWIVPTPLPNGPIERSSGLKFSYYGYEFEVPWTQLNREQKLKSMVFLSFASGAIVNFHDPSQEIRELEVMKQGDTKQGINIDNIFGIKATSSNYAFRSKILYLTPKDLSVLSSRQEMVGNSVLLIMKPMHAGIAKGGLL